MGLTEEIPFYMRIKEDSVAQVVKKKIFKVKKFFNDLPVKNTKVFLMKIEMFGEKVNLAGSRSEKRD